MALFFFFTCQDILGLFVFKLEMFLSYFCWLEINCLINRNYIDVLTIGQ